VPPPTNPKTGKSKPKKTSKKKMDASPKKRKWMRAKSMVVMRGEIIHPPPVLGAASARRFGDPEVLFFQTETIAPTLVAEAPGVGAMVSCVKTILRVPPDHLGRA
jgi:hypothetical protein